MAESVGESRGAQERKIVIKSADMNEDMQRSAIECASQALDKFTVEKDIAAHIKKEFDKKYNPTWHCIVGKNFGEELETFLKQRNIGFGNGWELEISLKKVTLG